jgi:hypothetical protein
MIGSFRIILLWGNCEGNGLRVNESSASPEPIKVNGVYARCGGFGIETAAAIEGESESDDCDECEEKAQSPVPTGRDEPNQSRGKNESVTDGAPLAGRFVSGVAEDVVGVDGDVSSSCAVGQELKGVPFEGTGGVRWKICARKLDIVSEAPHAGKVDLDGEVVLSLDGDGWGGSDDGVVRWTDDDGYGERGGGVKVRITRIVGGNGMSSWRQ